MGYERFYKKWGSARCASNGFSGRLSEYCKWYDFYRSNEVTRCDLRIVVQAGKSNCIVDRIEIVYQWLVRPEKSAGR